MSLIHKQVRPIDQSTDKNLTIELPKNFELFKKQNFAILSFSELQEACKYYPIFFVKNEAAKFFAIALFGIKENNILDDQYQFPKGFYIPLMMRTYPFALIDSNKKNDELIIGIDEAYKGINNKNGFKFFNDDSSLSKTAETIINNLKLTYAQGEQLHEILKIFETYDLFEEININFQPKDKTKDQEQNLKGLFQIKQDKLNQLEDAAKLKLVNSGAYFIAYSHFIAMSNLQKI